MCVLYFKGRSRSGDRSYRGRSRSGDQHCHPKRSRSGDRSYRGGVRRERSASGEVAIGRRGRDQEIAPTGEVLGERGRHQERSPLGEEVAIRRSLLQGRCQERCRHWEKRSRSGEGRYREIAPTGEVSGEMSPLGEEVAIGRRSLSGEGRSYSIFRQLRIKKTKRWSFPHRFAG